MRVSMLGLLALAVSFTVADPRAGHPSNDVQRSKAAVKEFELVLKGRASSCGDFRTECGDYACCSLDKVCCESSCCDSWDECTYDNDGNGFCVQCAADEVICGASCMPKGKECCGYGKGYCDEGENCCGSSCCAQGVQCLQDGDDLVCEGSGNKGQAPGRVIDGLSGAALFAVGLTAWCLAAI